MKAEIETMNTATPNQLYLKPDREYFGMIKLRNLSSMKPIPNLFQSGSMAEENKQVNWRTRQQRVFHMHEHKRTKKAQPRQRLLANLILQ